MVNKALVFVLLSERHTQSEPQFLSPSSERVFVDGRCHPWDVPLHLILVSFAAFFNISIPPSVICVWCSSKCHRHKVREVKNHEMVVLWSWVTEVPYWFNGLHLNMSHFLFIPRTITCPCYKFFGGALIECWNAAVHVHNTSSVLIETGCRCLHCCFGLTQNHCTFFFFQHLHRARL